MKAIIKQVEEIDRSSFAFRYPADKKGQRALPEDLDYVNAAHFSETIERVSNFLGGAIDAASKAAARMTRKPPYSGVAVRRRLGPPLLEQCPHGRRGIAMPA